jgi:hypothetical protein
MILAMSDGHLIERNSPKGLDMSGPEARYVQFCLDMSGQRPDMSDQDSFAMSNVQN